LSISSVIAELSENREFDAVGNPVKFGLKRPNETNINNIEMLKAIIFRILAIICSPR
jgi:hypothetical protein